MTMARESASRSEVRDGMLVDWDIEIPTDDDLVLRADVYRPVEDGEYQAILSYGPYGKGLAFQDGYAPQWEKMGGGPSGTSRASHTASGVALTYTR
jgi:hypothetical protein